MNKPLYRHSFRHNLLVLATPLLASLLVSPVLVHAQTQAAPCSGATQTTVSGTNANGALQNGAAAASSASTAKPTGGGVVGDTQQVSNAASAAEANAKAAASNLKGIFGRKPKPNTATGAPCAPAAAGAGGQPAPAAQPVSSPSPPAPQTQEAASTPAAAAPFVPPSSPAPAAAPFVPPSAPAAPSGPPDFSKIPDVAGVRLGMSLTDAKAALQKIYPSARIDALNGTPIGPQNQSFTSVFRVQANNTGLDQAGVDFTMPPNDQVVYHMTRITPQPHVAHDVLVAALRQKYGKESLAIGNAGKTGPPDSEITQMYWVFDEQGRPVSPIQVISGTPFGCGAAPTTNSSGGVPSGFYPSLVTGNSQMPPGYCGAAYVGILATMSNQAILDTLYLDMVDLPLATRSSQATDAWAKGLNDKARQQNIEKSQEVKPQL